MSAKRRIVRETGVEYRPRPIAEVFWLAFKEMDEESQYAFIRQLLDDPETYEEIADAVAVIEAREQPTRSFSVIEEELKREGHR